jgi:hypothetical protein
MRCICQILIVAALTAAALSAQNAPVVRIGPPHFLGAMDNFGAGLPFTRWRSGHMLAWDKQKEPTGKIGIYGVDLRLERIVSFSIERSLDVSIVSVDMTPSGELVASGVATQQDGAKARFLALISSKGILKRMVRTEPYLPQFVCASDDSVWTVGEEWLGPGRVRQDGYSVLREYSFDRGLLRNVIAREQFRGERVSFGGPVHSALLQCDGERVRLYSAVTRQWFEYDKVGGTLTRDDVEPFSDPYSDITGMVVTATGRILASVENLQTNLANRIFELSATAAGGKRRWIPCRGPAVRKAEGAWLTCLTFGEIRSLLCSRSPAN